MRTDEELIDFLGAKLSSGTHINHQEKRFIVTIKGATVGVFETFRDAVNFLMDNLESRELNDAWDKFREHKIATLNRTKEGVWVATAGGVDSTGLTRDKAVLAYRKNWIKFHGTSCGNCEHVCHRGEGGNKCFHPHVGLIEGSHRSFCQGKYFKEIS